ncbi:MAG: type II secretion system F family protein [Candidatus Humimicrobiaceae bacterium]
MSLLAKKNICKITVFFLTIMFMLALPCTYFLYAEQAPGSDIIIKKTYTEDFPDIKVDIDFTEGSQLGALEITAQDIIVTEDGKAAENISIERVDTITEPIGVVLAIDTSGSMKGAAIDNAKSAAALFMDQMRPIDEFSIVGFADEVKVYSTFTKDRKLLKDSISSIEANGETALFDGINIALAQFTGRNIKYKYIIVLTDGMDTVSKLKPVDDISLAQKDNVTIYSIALYSKDFNTADVENISESTNGEMLVAASPEQLKELYGNISRKIRNQYRISYTSTWPNIETINASITLNKSGATSLAQISYKNPYYAAAPSKILFQENSQYSKYFQIWWVRLIIYFAIFASMMLFVYVLISLLIKPQKILKQRTDLYGVKPSFQNSIEEEIKTNKEKSKQQGGIVGLTSRIGSKRGFTELFDLKLERAGLKIRGGEFMTFHFIIVIVAGIILQLLLKMPLVTFLVIFIIILAPFMVINIQTSQRVKKFEEQLPDTLQLISGSLKAGYSFNQSLTMAVEELKPPISDEFRRILNEIRVGMPESEALENSANRIGSEHFSWIVMAINVQRDVGGNLSEVMEIISDTIRERARVLNQIKALTSEGKLSAIILIALPFVIGIVLFVINRQYISLLITTRMGLMLLGMAAVMLVIGIIWILKISNIKY